MNKILFIDTETGGINPMKNSLLEIGLVVWREGKITDENLIKIKHDDYTVTPIAMDINDINLKEHEKDAVSTEKAIETIMKYKGKHFKDNKAVIGGHNTSFDTNFIKQLFKESDYIYGKNFSHREVDTASILKYLSHKERFNKELKSLNDAIDYFDLKITKKERHTGIADALITAKLYNKLLNI